MRKLFLLGIPLSLLIVHGASAQELKTTEEPEGYQFTPITDIPTTAVKDQSSSGTCWSYSTIGLLETELLRLGQPAVDLSSMFVVRAIYTEKAKRYVRFHGAISFSGGGASADVIDAIKLYGIVPEAVYQGLNYGTDKNQHGELDEVTKAYIDEIIKNPNKKLSTAWLTGFNAILDTYLGPIPETFNYKGKEYTPISYANSLGINPDDYIEIGSFTHHPFYQKFILEVPDNWAHGEIYNVPLQEFGEIIDYAVDHGFSLSWGSDVSEPGFSYKNGIAIVPDMQNEDLTGSDMARWTKLSRREKYQKAFAKPCKELTITQELRQKAFDNFETTDDHGMLIVGKAKAQNGDIFYKVKNSWGDGGKYNGYFYASRPFVLYKSLTVMLHKDGIPKEIRKKLNIK